MPSAAFPARLHVLTARASPLAVVLRRGPSGQVASFLWDRGTDRFTLGQWLKGRIYERRADLSPDGRHMIYFARDARWHGPTGGAWTAVSRAPWLRAVALWGKGDCWQGGGLFLDDGRYWLNGCHRAIAEDGRLERVTGYHPEGSFGGECLGVYYPRLLRDGWRLTAPVTPAGWCDHFEKPLARGWTLLKFANRSAIHPPGRGCYWDEHLLRAPDGTMLDGSDWEWAEADLAGVVYARQGALWRHEIGAEGLRAPVLLRDFNADRFAAVAPPYRGTSET
jgi:hypothetical protein